MTEKAYAPLANESFLIAQAQSDPGAFAAIYNFYFARVYNYTRYRVFDPVAADDLTSEIFERVLVRLDTYRPERGTFSAWLFAIARNTVNHNLRKQKIRQWLSLEAIHQHSGPEPGPDQVLMQNETNRQLLHAVSQLSDRDRELIALKFASQLSNRAIASLTGLSENHVAVLLHRAVKRIRITFDGAQK